MGLTTFSPDAMVPVGSQRLIRRPGLCVKATMTWVVLDLLKLPKWKSGPRISEVSFSVLLNWMDNDEVQDMLCCRYWFSVIYYWLIFQCGIRLWESCSNQMRNQLSTRRMRMPITPTEIVEVKRVFFICNFCFHFERKAMFVVIVVWCAFAIPSQ